MACMRAEIIPVPLDPEAAKAYKAASEEAKKKMQALVSLWLRHLATADPSRLKALMSAVSRKARARGLTPEVLDSLLKEA
jgi:ABC-type Zn uptake system ZnuABC Zn-binding protein ZnuA